MQSLDYKAVIADTFERVRKLSFEQKKDAPFDEQRINKLLDKILQIKKLFSNQATKLNTLIASIEEITWFSDLDEESLMKMNDLISSIRDLHATLIRQYIAVTFLRSEGIAKEEIKSFKSAIDDLKEIASDLESRFFFLPNLPEFNETTKELSLI